MYGKMEIKRRYQPTGINGHETCTLTAKDLSITQYPKRSIFFKIEKYHIPITTEKTF